MEVSSTREENQRVGEIYQSLDPWLCHPDQEAEANVCLQDLDATFVTADGTATVVSHVKASDPPIDCFYVYPTASFDTGGNSDLEANEEEIFIALGNFLELAESQSAAWLAAQD